MRRFLAFFFMVIVGLSSPAFGASEKSEFTERWIVRLQGAPTLEFAGTESAQTKGISASSTGLEATAPSATGRPFDALDPAVLEYERFLRERQTDFIDLAEASLGRKLSIAGSVQHVGNAIIINRLSAADRKILSQLPGVQSLERERLYRLQLSDGPALIGARNLSSGSVNGLPAVRGEGTIVGIIDSGINWGHEAFSDDPGFSGGYEYANPYADFLGLCGQANVPCNDKLVGVYDFTTDSTDGEDTDGHGTHVAAIAAGNEWRDDLGGVAPRAHLVSYRVCTEADPDDDSAGTCQSGAILQAFDQAVRDGVDVVNYSIGGDPFDPWRDSAAIRIFNLLDAGIGFVTSAGNSGPDPETVGSPAEAPWIFAVGSSTTRERVGRRVTISGVGAWFILYGSGPGLPQIPITNEPLRAGDAVGGTLKGCEAFPANAFAGAVALLRRGDCLFVDKVNNAEAAGAIAVIMMNNVGGSPVGMAGLEETGIPSGMVSLEDGEEILAELRAAGGDLPVSLPNARVTVISDSLGDQMSGFSSRGPASNVPNIMKPNVVAPGDNIQAAYIPNSTTLQRLSGTSMASPHVAGSMALLRQLQPDWTPAMLTSALETTAEADPVFSFGEPATIFDRGAGRIRVDLAARAGLYLPVTRSEFTAANPDFDGDPGALNLSGLVNENCGTSCTFTRTVTALANGGTWTVSAEGEPGIEVVPTEFSLAAGEAQELTITVTPASGGNVLEHGAVVLSPAIVSAPVPGVVQLVTQRLPVGVRALTGEVSLPEIVRVDASANRGRTSIDLGFIDDLSIATFETSDLVPAQEESFSLPQDPRNSNPYDGSEGTRTILIDVPADAVAVWAEILASSSNDMDLFVGRDGNGDGAAQESEEQCRSTSPIELERCIVRDPQEGRWWIVAQNWAANLLDDSVELEWAVLKSGNDSDDLVVYGPGVHAAGLLDIDLSWNAPGMLRDQRHLGLVDISAGSSAGSEVGFVPVAIERTSALAPSAVVLIPDSITDLVVPAASRHERIFVDVPPTTGGIRFIVNGDPAVSATVQRVDFDTILESAPQTPSPSGPVLAVGAANGEEFSVSLPPTVPFQPGRYFVVLDNPEQQEKRIDIRVELLETGTIARQVGLWSPVGTAENRRDQIAQGITWQQSGFGFIVWYSYDQDGVPLFYLGSGPVSDDSAVWSADIDAYVAADGEQTAVRAGSAVITMIDESSMVFSWSVNGGQGSDIKQPVAAPTCPEVQGGELNYTGHWFTPDQFEGGTSVIVSANAQAQIRYYYDLAGVGRWFLADDLSSSNPLAEDLDVYDFRGFCPSCPPSPVSSEIVGAYSRMFDTESTGMEVFEFVSRAPLNHAIQRELPISKLSEPAVCRVAD